MSISISICLSIYLFIYLSIYIYTIYIHGEYHVYLSIPLHPCYYLFEILLEANVATKEGNGQNDVNTEERDEIGVAIESWL